MICRGIPFPLLIKVASKYMQQDESFYLTGSPARVTCWPMAGLVFSAVVLPQSWGWGTRLWYGLYGVINSNKIEQVWGKMGCICTMVVYSTVIVSYL